MVIAFNLKQQPSFAPGPMLQILTLFTRRNIVLYLIVMHRQ